MIAAGDAVKTLLVFGKNRVGEALDNAPSMNDAYGTDMPTLDLADILFDNPCSPLPSPFGVAPESVVFSPEARDAFLDLFMPDLTGRTPRDQKATSVAD